MFIKTRFLLLLLGVCAGAQARGAETSARKTPTVDQVLERYVEATGGRAALEKLRSRVMTGRVEMTTLGASGKFEVWAKAPNQQMSSLEFEGFGAIREGYDGKVAWAVVPLQGLREKSGSELARVQRTAVFPRELKLRESYDGLKLLGAREVDGRQTWVVEATPKGGKPDLLLFDQQSGLLVREETTVESPLGEMTFELELGDYREVDGVKVPHLIRLPKPAEMGFQIRLDSVKHNVDVAAERFGKPSK